MERVGRGGSGLPQTHKAVHYLSDAKALYNQACMCYYTGHYLYGAKGTIHVLSCCAQSYHMLNVWDKGLGAESVQLQLSMLQVLYSTLTMCKGCGARPPKYVHLPKTQ